MSVHENAIALRFADRAAAYQALSELRHLDSATTEVRGAVLIERLDDGSVRVPEGVGIDVGKGTAVGGLVGSLVGVLGGPLGVLLGWGIGAVIGGGRDQRRAAEAAGTVGLFAQHVAPNGTAILVEAREADTQALDLLAMRYDAVLERRPADSVRAELKAMEEAVERIRKDESKQRRDHKRAETEQKVKDGVAALKQKVAA
ncbi:hypothetical protein SGFS_062490 [Streptomyces graminofaciens]|jgi:hypothetical protein|uniref:DUF1269 domain-containing protein n=1 Tax=Streptomyces graminofaciens TaxID=68212 RepID=A0ABM7FFK1_9ACTN|nr:hypothetical protein [Streptomyces graminofaciens]BBC34955.1 hypothetical protein SGFS_062490 [Streptomyces graminofaciens]